MRNTLSLWVNPWDNRFGSEIDRFVDDFFRPGVARNEAAFRPLVDIHETQSHYLVAVDVPGVKKEDIKVEFHDGSLIISGERKVQENAEGKADAKGNLFFERSFGKFARTVQLPEEIDVEKIEAAHADGVLTVKVAKAEAKKPKPISIQ